MVKPDGVFFFQDPDLPDIIKKLLLIRSMMNIHTIFQAWRDHNLPCGMAFSLWVWSPRKSIAFFNNRPTGTVDRNGKVFWHNGKPANYVQSGKGFSQGRNLRQGHSSLEMATQPLRIASSNEIAPLPKKS